MMFKELTKIDIMTIKRIVSFLPSATELLYEFGVEDNIYGVTHECRYPPEASLKPQVINSIINSEELDSNEIDKMTCKLLNDQKDIFMLDEKKLKDANPDLIISQETCEVCAAHTNQINNAVKILQRKPIIHSMNPHSMEEIIYSVTELGKIIGKEAKAAEITGGFKKRIQHVKKIQNKNKPRVLAIEWVDPFFTAGHWVPEMIQIAGGINLISKVGEHSRRLDFQEIVEANPDMIIMMPCGFDTKRTILEYNNILKENKKWNSLRAVKDNQIFAVDANSFFSKPSIRTIEGVEILAKIIQPKNFKNLEFSGNSFLQILEKMDAISN